MTDLVFRISGMTCTSCAQHVEQTLLQVPGVSGVKVDYLTMVEGLKLAAQTFTKDVSQLSCCAG